MGEVLRPFPRLLAAARDQGQELLRGQEARARAHVELMIRWAGAGRTWRRAEGGGGGLPARAHRACGEAAWLSCPPGRLPACTAARRQQGAVMTLNHYYMDTVNRIRDAARELREAECSDAGIIAARFNNEHGEAMYVSAAGGRWRSVGSG